MAKWHINVKAVWVVLLAVFFINLLWTFSHNFSRYTTRFDGKYWETRYLSSQWIGRKDCLRTDPHINPVTCLWDDSYYQAHKNEKFEPFKKETIGDDGVYTYAAWKYINGTDPTTFNAEIPPLGKYLIGLSIMLFNNENIFAFVTGLLCLFGFYFLNLTLFRNRLLAFLPVLSFSLEPLFIGQLSAPFLDSLYLASLFFTFAFFLRGHYIPSGLMLGVMMSTKASSSSFALVLLTMICFIFYQEQRRFRISDLKRWTKPLIFIIVSAAVVFFASYSVFFAAGHSLKDFLGVQKWILTFYAEGSKGNFLNLWQVMILGKWSTWWGVNSSVSEWSIIWPLLLLGSFWAGVIVWQKKIEKLFFLVIWVFLYGVFLMIVPLWPRYLLLLLPFLYNLSIWALSGSTKLRSLFRLSS